MTPQARAAYDEELRLAGAAEAAGDLDAAFAHLERAHILGQRRAFAHARTHLRMLRIGLRRRDAREVIGQLLRRPAALTKSRIWVPVGNTGGANVPALRPMPVPDDLKPMVE